MSNLDHTTLHPIRRPLAEALQAVHGWLRANMLTYTSRHEQEMQRALDRVVAAERQAWVDWTDFVLAGTNFVRERDRWLSQRTD